ncbi:GTPase [Gillisia sp. Hel_I_29]|uniref:GTPase n=1 Tax=Gillisia sp. Hel_I_29 TaxID=1249975 RepID=UPI0018CE3094|nr:GTPase [Gillisia sp. Hel_I_29]
MGEYNAGKTTIINILTGENFPTSNKPETFKAVEIPWKGYKLVDTPGLGSGNPDHDSETRKWLEEADLLLYFLTPDLFDSFAGRRFHDILKKYNRKQELMLVMNFIDGEGNDIEIFREELQEAIDPTPLEDYFPTFISAEYFNLSNQEKELEDKKYYMEKSGFNSFMETLDSFLLNKEEKSRLTTPLMKLYVLSQAIEVNSDFNKEIELINFKLQFLNETVKTIESITNDFEGNLNSDVLQVSGEIYSALDNPPKEFKIFLENKFAEFNEKITGRIDYLTQQSNLVLEDFESENIKLANSELSKEVEKRINESEKLKNIFGKVSTISYKKEKSSDSSLLKDIRENVIEFETLGGREDKMVSTIFKGDYSSLSKQLISKIDRNVVLDIGHKLGHKFKPWEAVKLTQKISTRIAQSVPFINIAVAVWDAGAHFYKKKKVENAERKLREFKEELRINFNNAILETKESVRKEMIQPLLTNFHLLKKLNNDKKEELMKVSEINESLLKEIEDKRQMCLDIHSEVHKVLN